MGEEKADVVGVAVKEAVSVVEADGVDVRVSVDTFVTVTVAVGVIQVKPVRVNTTDIPDTFTLQVLSVAQSPPVASAVA